MIPILLAVPLALAPLASLVGSLGWMAHSSTRT
jgi:hypothetical protein